MELAEMYADFLRWLGEGARPVRHTPDPKYGTQYLSHDWTDAIDDAEREDADVSGPFGWLGGWDREQCTAQFATGPVYHDEAAALIESAVLDELERRRAWFSDGERSDNIRELCMVIGHRLPYGGYGPTRLARLHAACKQAFGGG